MNKTSADNVNNLFFKVQLALGHRVETGIARIRGSPRRLRRNSLFNHLQPLVETLAFGQIQVAIMSEAKPGDGFLQTDGLRFGFPVGRVTVARQVELTVVSQIQAIGNAQLARVFVRHYRGQNHASERFCCLGL